jgi:hypothetical protein
MLSLVDKTQQQVGVFLLFSYLKEKKKKKKIRLLLRSRLPQ